MNSNDLSFYNDYFDNIKKIHKSKNFQFNHESHNYEGEIKIDSNKANLTFQVHIPESYPLNSIKFITQDFEGYPHQNFDGSICLNTEFVNHIYTRINLEVEKLLNYISKYVENDYEDEHYEYSAYDSQGLVTLLFEENDFDKNRFQVPFGEFKYSVLNYFKDQKNQITRITVLAQNLGNKTYSWSTEYINKETYTGCWIFINKEPVKTRKLRYTQWKDLVTLFPDTFTKYFSDFCKRLANYKIMPTGFKQYIMFAIGYKIPRSNSSQVHWDLVLLPREDFPRNIRYSKQLINHYDRPILWDSTQNISYDRFFGRGSINQTLAKKRILIIGIGAIGSSLAEILTRGGARKIDLADVDLVEPGNICRSTYSFCDVGLIKTESLKNKLFDISPYIEVELFDNLRPQNINTQDGREILKKISKYDIIFDCSANNEIIQMLTDFSLENTVFYLSISDKACELICICNKDNKNMIERRNQMLYSFGGYRAAEFREGTGCWHPTFEASYFDINQLLNHSIKNINAYYDSNIQPKSFYSYYLNNIIASSEDIHYNQPSLNLRLIIESDCFKNIETLSRLHYPNEFGGILTGSYLNNYKEVVISNIICPDNYVNSPYKFEPDPNDLNKKLKIIYKKYDGKIEYVGDWHSHPDNTNQYSPPDFISIEDIAKSSKVNTHNPVLLIAAYNKDSFTPGFYVYHGGKLHRYRKDNGVI
ncbi:MAG: ThiF family adenylyltransferase [Bacteroidales bacterium]|nr:ThiF family adenylyltransferase [Bacteroidales bacterium]